MTSSVKNKFTAVSIFTGAGGLDIGIEQSGFDVVSALEIHPKYSDTIKLNKSKKIPIPSNPTSSYFKNTLIINDDIANVSAAQLKNGYENIDCLVGGPPCQAFSSAGKQQSVFDQRGKLIYEYFRILKELHPKVFLFENVRGLVTAKGEKAEPGEILKELLHLFESLGYNCRVALLNAADYGAYQRRVRCFIIGSRIAAAPHFPEPEFSKDGGESSVLPGFAKKRWKTLREFLQKNADSNKDHWTRPTEKLYEQLKNIPMGKGLRSQGRAEATRPGGHWGYRQGTFIANLDLPARTVTGSSSQDWIRLEDGSLRRITMKEAARLQGFPTEWEFCGSKTDKFQQIGNAVPIVFGEELGKVLYQYLNGGYKTYPTSNEIEIPKNIKKNIRYTKYDNAKNGSYRVNNFPVNNI